MSKAKLKAGDRVRVTHTDYPDHIPVGVIATVDTPDGDAAHLVYHGHSLYFFSSEFEVIPHFKVGDRVRLTKDNDGFGVAGDTGSVVVENGGAEDCRVKFDRIIRDRHEWWVPWISMERIYTSCAAAEVDNLADEYGGPKKAKLKKGDRVFVVNNSSDRTSHIGKTGKVDHVDAFSCGVLLDGEDMPLLFDTNELENVAVTAPATATTLRIEDGKFYKTRDGRKVGPMVGATRGYDPQYPFTVNHYFKSGYGTAWRADGTFSPDLDEQDDADLIAEWTDEPVAAAPKFKVGDRVKQKHWSDSNWSTVTRFDGITLTIRDDDGFTGKYDNLSDFETKPTTIADIVARHSQSGTAIVAVIENGQPRPATRPYVHGSTHLAETEANRLASANPGKEFGVYTLGAVAKVEKTYDHEWQRLAANGETYAAKKKLEAVAGIDFYQAAKIVNDWREAA